jgi:hypothetical protein
MAVPNLIYKVTHDISSVVQATHIQATDGSEIVDRNIIPEYPGLNYAEIYLDVTAPIGGGATPELQLAFKEEISGEWYEGETLVSPITVAAGTNRRYRLQTVFVGPRDFAVMLITCPDDTAIKVTVERTAEGLLS